MEETTCGLPLKECSKSKDEQGKCEKVEKKTRAFYVQN